MGETVSVAGNGGSPHYDTTWAAEILGGHSAKPVETAEAPASAPVVPELQGVRKRDEVCIIGYAPGRELAPFRDQNVDIWGMNDLWGQWGQFPTLAPFIRWDAWFDPHKREVMRLANRMKEEQIKWLQAQPVDFPIFTLERFDDIPGSRRLPYAEVCAQLGVKMPPYFTSTPAYMVAVALALDYKRIHVYGVNLLGTGEYEYQRPCLEFWIGYAMGRGVEVVIPEESTLCKATFLYGYDTHGLPEADRVLEWLSARLTEGEHNRRGLELEQARLGGQLEAAAGVRDMLRHARYGAYIPPIKGVSPEAANEQQKRDAAKRSMLLVNDAVERVRSGDLSALDHILPAVAVAHGLPDHEAMPKPVQVLR